MARLSDGVAAPNMREQRPTPIKAAPVKINYDKPQVGTYSPNTGYTPPVGTYYPPNPVYQAPAWQAPAQTYQAAYQPAVTNITPMAAAAPVDPPKPPPPPKKTVDDFAKLYDTNQELAAVDSTFAEQRSLYADLLKKYIADYEVQKKNVNTDADLGIEGIKKNKVNGLTSLNEDFAARGLGYSGLQAKEHGNASSAYDKQSSNVELGRTRSVNDLDFRKNKYVGENGENGSNMGAARREAYARLVAKQDIV